MTQAKDNEKISDGYTLADPAKMVDDFRMIFSIEGSVYPHIARVFQAFRVKPGEIGIFMDYYCSQILRLDLYGTVEAEFAYNLKTAGLLELVPVKFDGESKFNVCAQALQPLQNDIDRLKRRLKLMSGTGEPFDCFTSESEDFQNEQYFLTQSRLKTELQSGMNTFLRDRLMRP